MKKMFRVLAVSVLGVFLLAGPAMALPTLPITGGWSWVNAPFWTNTDYTTGIDGNSQFQLQFEGFNPVTNDASFGLFYVANINAPSSPTLFEVFTKGDEPSYDTKTVSFRNSGGNISITLGDPNGAPTWTSFKSVFGFYFDFVNPNYAPVNGKYYSSFGLDTAPDGVRNVFTAAGGGDQVIIVLDKTPDNDADAVQMTVSGNDLRPVPAVPEPGTLLLLGSGLLGLVFYGRKRMKA